MKVVENEVLKYGQLRGANSYVNVTSYLKGYKHFFSIRPINYKLMQL